MPSFLQLSAWHARALRFQNKIEVYMDYWIALAGLALFCAVAGAVMVAGYVADDKAERRHKRWLAAWQARYYGRLQK